ncbi:Alpha/Beta hydrolase protein [Aspergillus varians]
MHAPSCHRGSPFATFSILASAASLGAYNIDPDSISLSGFSSGGFAAAQLGVAYSSIFNVGFGVFAGGPYDCARNQPNSSCMWNNVPSITAPIAHMISWSGSEIDDVANLRHRRVYMQVGELDRTIGPNILAKLKVQLSSFVNPLSTMYIVTPDSGHTFPTDYDAPGDTPCSASSSPYISNCGYDGAGAVLEWIHGALRPKNTGVLTGEIIPFEQDGEYGAIGMDRTGYLYIPASCRDRLTMCKLHVVLHGCLQAYGLIGDKFVRHTGYNKWADTNNIIVLYPQTTVDNSLHTIWDGGEHSNPYACWDWIGLYGDDVDQKGGTSARNIYCEVGYTDFYCV